MANLPNPFLGLNVQNNIKVVVNPKNNKFKANKSGTNGTHICVILDESGSMQNVAEETRVGFNTYVEKQLENPENCNLTAVKFNGSDVIDIFTNATIASNPKLTKENYYPNGWTNLLDAIGITIERINKILKDTHKNERPAVLFVIFTDGQENSSKTYNNEKIKEMVAACEKKEWGFSFFGANIDAFAVGSTFGMRSANTMQYDTANMDSTFEVAASSSMNYRTMKSAGVSTAEAYSSMFSDEDRAKSMGRK